MSVRPTNKEVLWIAILTVWTALHIIFLIVGGREMNDYTGKRYTYQKFYPFDEGSTLIGYYDTNEFFAYVLPFWIIFLVYYFLIRLVGKKSH